GWNTELRMRRRRGQVFVRARIEAGVHADEETRAAEVRRTPQAPYALAVEAHAPHPYLDGARHQRRGVARSAKPDPFGREACPHGALEFARGQRLGSQSTLGQMSQ